MKYPNEDDGIDEVDFQRQDVADDLQPEYYKDIISKTLAVSADGFDDNCLQCASVNDLLSNPEGLGYYNLVDSEDYELLQAKAWCFDNDLYCRELREVFYVWRHEGDRSPLGYADTMVEAILNVWRKRDEEAV